MKYQGDWVKGEREGFGILHYNLEYDCDKRVGKFKNNEPVKPLYLNGAQTRKVIQILLTSAFVTVSASILLKMYRKSG
jgi:hypothetical protein